MSRNRDKYASIRKERYLGSYIVKGKDSSIRIGHTLDLFKTLREIKKIAGLGEVVLFKGTTEAQTQEVMTCLKSSLQPDHCYSIEFTYAKALMIALLSPAECLVNPNIELRRPKKWKPLSSWIEGEMLAGKLYIVPTNKKFNQRFIIEHQDGSVTGLYTNESLKKQLDTYRDGETISIECKKPFKPGIDDIPNQASEFKVISILDKRTHVEANNRDQSNPRPVIKRIRR